MTYEDAYAEGFCKAAEVIGVDPLALVKRADIKAKILGLLTGAGKGKGVSFGRYKELLLGGNRAKMRALSGPGGAAMGQFAPSVAPNGVGGRFAARLRAILGSKEFDKGVVNEARRALTTQARTGLTAAGILGGGTAAGYGINSALKDD